MVLCRAKLKMSMNQIAQVFGRSRATIHKYVNEVGTNNRRISNYQRIFNNSRFKHVFLDLKVKMKMFLQHLISFQEAMTMESISVAALDWYISENCFQEEEEDPA